MNNKRILIGTAILSIIIYTGILLYLLTKIYNQETERFDYRYREIVDKSVKWMLEKHKGNGFEKPNYILDGVSQNFVDFLNTNQIIDTAEFQKTIYNQFNKILANYQEVDSNLMSFLKTQQVFVPFKSELIIQELNLIDFDQVIPIHKKSKELKKSKSKTSQNAILANQYQFVGNHFNMKVDYYIDFSNKKKEVLGRITLSIILAFISLLVVIGVFLLTLRNLFREKKLSQMKTDFINNMTHELKTPLSTICIASKSLENKEILSNPEKVTETARIISRQNSQLTKQINHLLEISKWERGQFELDIKRVDIIKTVKGIAESVKWENKDTVKIEETYSIENCNINIDETMITSAILNIIANAIKYNQNNPTIKIDVWADENLHIAITDNGIGIAKDEINHIFDKFYRVSTGNIHNVKGLGLGLFYVKQIVQAHGGTINVQSSPNRGSTFTLTLPKNDKN
ncbi:MAG: sensor histidine kinase [Bacteroidales bacterium]